MTASEKRAATIAARKASAARMEASYQEAERIVINGVCPNCGRKLKRNLSLTGWYQCEQFGAVGFRAEADQPSCSFQTFTRN